jgi:hypothetical protein
VTWRDGVHITGTPIWCDARRRREVCFLSSADRLGRPGHGQLIGTSITLALLAARDHGNLAVPVRQRFTLGTVRLELIPSGRGYGAAALHVDIAGKSVLYAGAVRTSAGGVGDAAELRTCDAVVVAAPYGEAHHRFPPLPEAIAATADWTRRQLAADRRPVLIVDSVLDGLEVASRLAAEGIPIAAPRALREAGQRIAALVPSPQVIDGSITIGGTITPRATGRPAREPPPGVPSPAAVDPSPASGIPAIAAPGREPRAIVWLDADRAGLARSLGDRGFATALVSGRALPGAPTECDAGFAWAAAADRAQLLGWIEATGAREVFVTGACAEAIVGALGGRSRVIGPPRQMPLFPSEATP